MHELSIAYSLVETAAAAAHQNEVHAVDRVKLRLGILSGVSKEALLFAYDIAAANTPLMGSTLEIEELPVVALCVQCQQEHVLPTVHYLCCPVCHTSVTRIIQGKEIELVSLTSHDESKNY